MKNKVFGIGFHKTGTSSLGHALTLLGYRVCAQFGVLDPDIAQNALPMALKLAQEYDAAQDNPWPILYQELDQHFPGSKFILTVRPAERWISSQIRHFGSQTTPMREWIYGAGCPAGNEQIYIARYLRHNAEVQAYFASRPDDLLVMDLAAGDGWPQLCAFLGLPVPEIPFPHQNSADERAKGQVVRSPLRRVLSKIKHFLLPAPAKK